MVWDSYREGGHAVPPPTAPVDVRQFGVPLERVLASAAGPVVRATALSIGGRHLYQVEDGSATMLYDGDTGVALSPLSESTATALLSGYAGTAPVGVRLVTERSYEYMWGDLPAWRGAFADGRIIHISAASGQATSWTDRAGMISRALYFRVHALKVTGRPGIDAAIAFGAILLSLSSLLTGALSYLPRRPAPGERPVPIVG